MKKLLLCMSMCLWACFLFCQEDGRIFVHPGRETFIHFPSVSLGNSYTVNFFLPEDFVPLSQKYPLVVLLGITSKQAAQVADFQRENPAIVVGINFEEKDYTEHADQIVRFLTKELLPYVDTNYLTLASPEHRLLAAQGPVASQIALRIAQNEQLFGALGLVSPGDSWTLLPAYGVRTLIIGTQPELAHAQSLLEQNTRTYGPDFALRYISSQGDWFSALNTSYLWAPLQDVQVKSLHAAASANAVSLRTPAPIHLRVWAILQNNEVLHYVPPVLRIGPPYLTWDSTNGTLYPIPGAEKTTVKLRNEADKPNFLTKIRLKR